MTKPPNLPIQAKPWSMVQSQAPEFMITEPAVGGGARLLPGAAPAFAGIVILLTGWLLFRLGGKLFWPPAS